MIRLNLPPLPSTVALTRYAEALGGGAGGSDGVCERPTTHKLILMKYRKSTELRTDVYQSISHFQPAAISHLFRPELVCRRDLDRVVVGQRLLSGSGRRLDLGAVLDDGRVGSTRAVRIHPGSRIGTRRDRPTV